MTNHLFNKHQNELRNQTLNIKTNEWMKNELHIFLMKCSKSQKETNKHIGLKTNHIPIHGNVQTNQLDEKQTIFACILTGMGKQTNQMKNKQPFKYIPFA